MGWLTIIAAGAYLEHEEAQKRRTPEPEPLEAKDIWRAAQSCYPGVFAPRELHRGLAEVSRMEREASIEKAAYEAYQEGKRRARNQ